MTRQSGDFLVNTWIEKARDGPSCSGLWKSSQLPTAFLMESTSSTVLRNVGRGKGRVLQIISYTLIYIYFFYFIAGDMAQQLRAFAAQA